MPVAVEESSLAAGVLIDTAVVAGLLGTEAAGILDTRVVGNLAAIRVAVQLMAEVDEAADNPGAVDSG